MYILYFKRNLNEITCIRIIVYKSNIIKDRFYVI